MRKTLLLALVPLLLVPFARAGQPAPAVSMDVAPTTLQLVPGTPGLFYVANHGDTPVDVRIDGFDWSQPGGADTLVPSADLVVSPGEATIAPGARQLVRVLAPPASGERSFRLMVSQLPGADAPSGNAVRILLRFGVPVFSGDPVSVPPALHWAVGRSGHAYLLTVRNDGAHTAKLSAIRVAGTGGDMAGPDDDTFAYLLPGATRSFIVSHPPAGGALHVTAREGRSGGDISADIPAPP